jgi:hypothetical protein
MEKWNRIYENLDQLSIYYTGNRKHRALKIKQPKIKTA